MKQRTYPPPQCVGCLKRSDTCRLTVAGETCRKCRVELQRVQGWAREALSRARREQEPAAVRYGRGV